MSLRNVEVKGEVREWEKSLMLAERLAGAPPVLLRQRDTFYGGSTVAGRLKLRRENDTAVLVHYERPDVPGPKLSDYCLCPVSDPDALHLCLERALSSTSQLNKDRYLFIVGQTRIHMDRVEGLGDFAELEVVLEPEQTLEEGEKICNDLLTQLEIDSSNLLSGSYSDMLTAKNVNSKVEKK